MPISRRSGFTLLESSLTVTLVASALTVLGVHYLTLIEQADARSERGLQHTDARVILAEIEESIRTSEEVQQASSGILVVSTRYFVDTDDDLERVRYSLVDSELRREVAHGSSGYREPEVLLTDVSSFAATAFEIEDSFQGEDYEDLVTATEGFPDAADTAAKVRYRLIELSSVDSRLKSYYDGDEERLSVGGLLWGDGLCLSPPLRREGLIAETEFTPATVLTAYSALHYGTHNLAKDAVIVVFALGGITLQSYSSGFLIDIDTASGTFAADQDFRVRLRFQSGVAFAEVERDGWKDTLGPVTVSPSVDQHRLWAVSTTTRGWWDDLHVRYATVELSLGVEIGGETVNLVGGAYPR